jgi:gliding motility-associated-like protein
VFNRWGQVVFSTTDINKGWNGQFNGKPQPLGSYVYAIKAKTSTGKVVTKQGNVTLIR